MASVKKVGVKILSLDEQIAQLESQLESGSSSDDDDYDDNWDEGVGISGSVKRYMDETDTLKVEKDRSGNILRLVSKLDDERITPLPKSLLPSIHCSFKTSASKTGPKQAKPKIGPKPGSNNSNNNIDSGDSERKIRFADELPASKISSPLSSASSTGKRQLEQHADISARPLHSALKSARLTSSTDGGDASFSNNNSSSNCSSNSSISINGNNGIVFGRGLAAAVQDLQNNYQPSSWEKKPFFCRACQHQAKDLSGFEEHKLSKEHLARSTVERKASSCQVCRKEFTSPEQLKEHLKGKWHIERMEMLTARQTSGKNYS